MLSVENHVMFSNEGQPNLLEALKLFRNPNSFVHVLSCNTVIIIFASSAYIINVAKIDMLGRSFMCLINSSWRNMLP